MELTITKGRGYVVLTRIDRRYADWCDYPIDSIYTPVERVILQFRITRVGQITDYDKLTLDVNTNGTLHRMKQSALLQKY